MSCIKLIVFIFFYSVFYVQCKRKLPDYITVCERDQRTINGCLNNTIENLRPILMKGMPELGVPGVDPFLISKYQLIPEDNQGLRAIGKDIVVTGAGNFVIKKVDVDLDKLIVRTLVYFPKLHFEGKYKVDINLLLVPIRGEGKMYSDVLKCDIDVVLKMKLNKKDGVDYIDFTGADVDIKIKDYMIKLEGFFDGDKVLEEAATLALNENKAEFIKAAKPFAEKYVSEMILNMSNKITNMIPRDELFPEP